MSDEVSLHSQPNHQWLNRLDAAQSEPDGSNNNKHKLFKQDITTQQANK